MEEEKEPIETVSENEEEINLEELKSENENSFENSYDQEGLAEMLNYEISFDEDIKININLSKYE